ncbi:MAG TPA: hypothetical protein VHG29_02300 [Novosphingobium sp.]|nr:hypothetical protein [Novosphingobium sp.]
MNQLRFAAALSPLHRWALMVAGGALWLSGVAWLVLHFYVPIESDFGPEANPLEPWLLKAHGFAMIAALLAIGGLLTAHVTAGWEIRQQRVRGIAIAAAVLVLIATGYLLYYAGNEQLRGSVSTVHWVLGLGSPAIFLWHRAGRRKADIPSSK